MKILAVDDDFLHTDVSDLMNTPVEPEKDETDINEMLSEFDKELMSFKPRKKRLTWPSPIGDR